MDVVNGTIVIDADSDATPADSGTGSLLAYTIAVKVMIVL
jgi:hypothetical protein